MCVDGALLESGLSEAVLKQSPYQGTSVHSADIFAMPPVSSNKTKSYLKEWGDPEISKTAR